METTNAETPTAALSDAGTRRLIEAARHAINTGPLPTDPMDLATIVGTLKFYVADLAAELERRLA